MINPKDISLRQAKDNDTKFIESLVRQSMKPVVLKVWPNDEAAQEAYYRDSFLAPATDRIITYKDNSVGRLNYLIKDFNRFGYGRILWLRDIHTLPQYWSYGIGLMMLNKVILSARENNLPVLAGILKENDRALKAFKRFGFQIEKMEVNPLRWRAVWRVDRAGFKPAHLENPAP